MSNIKARIIRAEAYGYRIRQQGILGLKTFSIVALLASSAYDRYFPRCFIEHTNQVRPCIRNVDLSISGTTSIVHSVERYVFFHPFQTFGFGELSEPTALVLGNVHPLFSIESQSERIEQTRIRAHDQAQLSLSLK